MIGFGSKGKKEKLASEAKRKAAYSMYYSKEEGFLQTFDLLTGCCVERPQTHISSMNCGSN